MNAKSLKEQALEWLGNNGYPLEMQVARRFRQSDAFQVTQSRYYLDSSTGKLREADVVATWVGIGRGGAPTQVDVVAECKALDKSKGDRKAWILFTDSEAEEELGTEFSIALLPKRPEKVAGLHRAVESSSHDSAPRLFENTNPICYAITQMGTTQNGKDWPYDATRQVIASSLGVISTDEYSPSE